MSRKKDDPERDDPRPAAAAGEEETPRFGEAMTEIEAILRRIEGEQGDIDDLAEELRRASHLLEVARSKIRRAEVEVTQIVQSLDGAQPEAAAQDEAQADLEDDGDEEDQDDIPF